MDIFGNLFGRLAKKVSSYLKSSKQEIAKKLQLQTLKNTAEIFRNLVWTSFLSSSSFDDSEGKVRLKND